MASSDLAKKLTERELIGDFLSVCPDFEGYEFVRYDENPDLVYGKDGRELGFESIVIADGQRAAQQYFEQLPYRIEVLPEETAAEQLEHIETFMHNKLVKHFRKYQIDTVFVFSLVGENLKISAGSLAGVYMMPQFAELKIVDYYVFDGRQYAKIAEPQN